MSDRHVPSGHAKGQCLSTPIFGAVLCAMLNAMRLMPHARYHGQCPMLDVTPGAVLNAMFTAVAGRHALSLWAAALQQQPWGAYIRRPRGCERSPGHSRAPPARRTPTAAPPPRKKGQRGRRKKEEGRICGMRKKEGGRPQAFLLLTPHIWPPEHMRAPTCRLVRGRAPARR